MTPVTPLGIGSSTSHREGSCLMSTFWCYHQTLLQNLLLYVLMVPDMALDLVLDI